MATLGLAGSAHAAGLSPARAQGLADGLGAKAAGTYFDASRDAIVVSVTDQAAAERVSAAGGIARVVKHSTAELEQVDAELTSSAEIPGTAWGIDPFENTVVVSVDDSDNADSCPPAVLAFNPAPILPTAHPARCGPRAPRVSDLLLARLPHAVTSSPRCRRGRAHTRCTSRAAVGGWGASAWAATEVV